MTTVDTLAAAGEIGGRTVHITDTGAVACHTYPVAELPEGHVRIRTTRSAVSPGTEMTYVGTAASNVYLHKRWNPDLRLFESGMPGIDHPIAFGYRAAGVVSESRDPHVPVGHRVFGNWRHTEFTVMPGERALAQALTPDVDWTDAVDVGQMVPICVNAGVGSVGREIGLPAVVFGAGPIGLITAQIIRDQGAIPVHVVDRIPERLEVARGLGLATVLASPGVDVARVLKAQHGADGIPVAWECSGAVPALAEAIRVVRRRGVVIAVGFYQGGAGALELSEEFHHNAVTVQTAQIGNPYPPYDRPLLQARALQLIRRRAIVVGGLPRRTFRVEDAAAAFEALHRPADVLQVDFTYG